MKITSSKRTRGMTLLELTVVILVLLSLISILFIGARAWKKGSDRAGCIMQIRNVQLAPGRTSMLPTGLAVHCIADANAAMHEIFTAKEPYKPKLRRDR